MFFQIENAIYNMWFNNLTLLFTKLPMFSATWMASEFPSVRMKFINPRELYLGFRVGNSPPAIGDGPPRKRTKGQICLLLPFEAKF